MPTATFGRRRRDHMRLGFAVQLGTVRFLGTFLADPTEVPAAVAAVLARQLGIADPGGLLLYRGDGRAGSTPRRSGAATAIASSPIRSAQWRLIRWLYALCWTGTDRPSALFDRATAWLVAHKVLLPGASVLERIDCPRADPRQQPPVAAAGAPDHARTEGAARCLLVVPEGGRQSPFDRLRQGPVLQSGHRTRPRGRAPGRGTAIRRRSAVLPTCCRSRVLALARFAGAAKAQAVARMPQSAAAATLLAFIRTLGGQRAG